VCWEGGGGKGRDEPPLLALPPPAPLLSWLTRWGLRGIKKKEIIQIGGV